MNTKRAGVAGFAAGFLAGAILAATVVQTRLPVMAQESSGQPSDKPPLAASPLPPPQGSTPFATLPAEPGTGVPVAGIPGEPGVKVGEALLHAYQALGAVNERIASHTLAIAAMAGELAQVVAAADRAAVELGSPQYTIGFSGTGSGPRLELHWTRYPATVAQ